MTGKFFIEEMEAEHQFWTGYSTRYNTGRMILNLKLSTTGDISPFDQFKPGDVIYANYDVLSRIIEMHKENLNSMSDRINYKIPEIKKVIFNNPATIILWLDGTKTVVKCSSDDIYDKEKGFAMAVIKKLSDNSSQSFHSLFKQYCKEE